MINSAYFVKSTPPRAFSVSFFKMHGRYVTDILKVYMKKCIAEKFVQIFTGF